MSPLNLSINTCKYKIVISKERTESDHLPVEAIISGQGIRNRSEMDNEIKTEKTNWTGERIIHCEEKYENWTYRGSRNGVERERQWKEIKEKAKSTTKKKMKKKEWISSSCRKRYNKEWKKRKRELRKELRKLKNNKITKGEYAEKKKGYKKWCKEKRKEYEKEEEKKIKSIKIEAEAWKYINKFRRKKEGVDKNIKLNSWRKHFMEILEGVNERIKIEDEEDKEREEEEIQDLEPGEIRKQINRLKNGKAAGSDGIRNEKWKYMTEGLREAMHDLMKKIWREGNVPEEWREGLIIPIYKKGEKKKVENYRGVTLLNTAYKIYARILNERLLKEVEEKLGETQFGFRKGRGVIDAIYILNFIINRELSKPKGKVFAFFADLKAAFDKIDRKVLAERMRRMEVSVRLRKRIMEIYEETKNRVRVGEKKTDIFWTKIGVRQGCPMSPTLFNIYIADLEEDLGKGEKGGIVIGKEMFRSLTYADDIVLVAKSEKELKEMLKRLEKFLNRKKLKLNPEKSKILVFERGKRRKRKWRWEGEEIEEVKEIKYLGFILQKNGGTEKHIKERIKRTAIAMKKTWSLELFKNHFEKRMEVFEALVGSVALYGAEIWGWLNEERLDKIQVEYVKWILGLERETPSCILLEENKIKEIRVKALEKAIKYEEMARKSKKRLVKDCIKEIDKIRGNRKQGKWEKKRKNMKETIGITREEEDNYRQKGVKEVVQRAVEKITKKERMERRKKIHKTKYNSYYKLIHTEQLLPEYLKDRKKERKMIAKFRCKSEMRGGQYWKEKKKTLEAM